MSPGAPYLRMAQNNAWANQTLYAALAGMSERAFAAARPGFFPSLSATLDHIFAVDLFYCGALSMAGRGLAVFDHTQIDPPPRPLPCVTQRPTLCLSVFAIR